MPDRHHAATRVGIAKSAMPGGFIRLIRLVSLLCPSRLICPLVSYPSYLLKRDIAGHASACPIGQTAGQLVACGLPAPLPVPPPASREGADLQAVCRQLATSL